MHSLTGNRWMAFGDSLTFDIVAPIVGAWRYYLNDQLAAFMRAPVKWCGDFNAAGLPKSGNKMVGTSGLRIRQVIDSYDPAGNVQRWKPNYAAIHLATNDMTQLNSGAWAGSVAQSVSDMDDLLDLIFGAKPDIHVFLFTPIPNVTAGADQNITDWIAAARIMVAAHPYASRIHWIETNAAFKANANWATDYFPSGDPTHVNALGKELMANQAMTDIAAEIEVPARVPAYRRRNIKPRVAACRYRNSSPVTDLGADTILNFNSPIAIEWELDMRDSRTAYYSNANGIFNLETDQATSFVVLLLKNANGRGIEFGSNLNFLRAFPSVANTWDTFVCGSHHFVLVYNGQGRTSIANYRLYIDGLPVTLTTGAGLGASSFINEIGGIVSGSARRGTFDMTRARIWVGGSVMTAEQVQNLYFSDILPTGPTLVRNFKHEDTAGTQLTDSASGVHGTIGAGVSIVTSPLPMRARTAATARSLATARTPVSA